MSCPHTSASVREAMIVERDGTKWLRSFCRECRNYVDTIPNIDRDGNVSATEWVPTGYTVPEFEIDPKETTHHV